MSIAPIAQSINQGVTSGRNYLDKRANTILSPKTAKGISGFLFDVPKDEQVTLSYDVTDHFTENNSFLNDHIVRKPIQITLSGWVGELVFEQPDGVAGALSLLNNRLSTVNAYLGDLTPGFVQTAQRAVSAAQSVV